jgi:hypothetical protein
MHYELDKKLTIAASSPLGRYFLRYLSEEQTGDVISYLTPICIKAYTYDNLPEGAKVFLDVGEAFREEVGIGRPSDPEIEEIAVRLIESLTEEQRDSLEELGQDFADYVSNFVPPEAEVKPIKNKDSYPDCDFFDEENMQVIGDVGGVPLILIGRERGTNAMIVARDDRPYFHGTFLEELIAHTQDNVNINEEFRE